MEVKQWTVEVFQYIPLHSTNLNLAQVIFVSFTSSLCVFLVRVGKGVFEKEVIDLLCSGV